MKFTCPFCKKELAADTREAMAQRMSSHLCESDNNLSDVYTVGVTYDVSMSSEFPFKVQITKYTDMRHNPVERVFCGKGKVVHYNELDSIIANEFSKDYLPVVYFVTEKEPVASVIKAAVDKAREVVKKLLEFDLHFIDDASYTVEREVEHGQDSDYK